MDIFIPIALIIVLCILFSICGWCCKRHREGTVYGYGGAPVAVANQHVNASPVVVPPYPIDARHPTPQVMPQAPGLGFVGPTGGYQAGYPPTSAPGFYCPPGVGMQMGAPYPPAAAPYPPANGPGYPPANGPGYPPVSSPYPPQTAPPPSYSEAVAHPPAPQAPTNELYAKQSPYNPNY